MMEERIYPPMHPGRVLELEFLKSLKITPYALAKAIGVDAPRVYEIVRGRRAITADTALRLARYFGTSPEFWLNLQSHYDLEVEEGRAVFAVTPEEFHYNPIGSVHGGVYATLLDSATGCAVAETAREAAASARRKKEGDGECRGKDGCK